jgi:GT2 family glycosyltransferase
MITDALIDASDLMNTDMREKGLPTAEIGVVVIGRNEGQRLVDCFASLDRRLTTTVYVDSGSSDDSVAQARRCGATVVALDVEVPFTAGRARNAGFERLVALKPDLAMVQFIDGDCQLDRDWLETAASFLGKRPELALVCGRRRELHPEKSIYNAMCDLEWDTPVGKATECGGDFLVRVEAFQSVDGFAPALIAGEEPDLCVRLREKGWSLWRLDAEMTRHDAAITRFGQWWLRNVRAGHAFAEVAGRHGGSDFGIWKRSRGRAMVWGGLPLLIAAGVVLVHPALLALLLVYPLQVVRLALRSPATRETRWTSAFFAVLGKFPELQGIAKFHINRFLKKRHTIIEYKNP